ncbi:MAG TPA: alpha/beta hydrolase [Motilibacteraceae bacterium]|nr:alpha/beta hydrolase [Motilibacteraceae bacterium]
MHILLIAGLWLDGSTAWGDVAAELTAAGHHPVPVPLPGQGDGNTAATLQDQVDAVLAAVDASDGRCLVVGHSAACTLAWIAADRRRDKVAKVALIGGFPEGDGEPYFGGLTVTDGALPFPGWEPFEGPDSADLDEEARREFAQGAIPVPEAVARGTVHLSDEGRFDVPVVMVCPEFTPDQAKEWVAQDASPELAKVRHISYVDIDSGHWPMTTKPAELARLLAQAADKG